MTILIDGTSPPILRGTTSPLSTASFSPPANSMLLAFAEADESNTFALSNTGGLSFTALDSVSVTGRNSLASWVTTIGGSAPGSMTVTSTKTGSFTAHMLRVFVLTGAESTFTGAHGVAQSNTITLAMTANGSWGFAAVGDNIGATTDAAGTGCTYHDAEAAFGGVSGGTLKRTTADGTSGGNTTMSAGSAATNMSIIMVEVKPASTTPAPAPSQLVLPQLAAIQSATW